MTNGYSSRDVLYSTVVQRWDVAESDATCSSCEDEKYLDAATEAL